MHADKALLASLLRWTGDVSHRGDFPCYFLFGCEHHRNFCRRSYHALYRLSLFAPVYPREDHRHERNRYYSTAVCTNSARSGARARRAYSCCAALCWNNRRILSAPCLRTRRRHLPIVVPISWWMLAHHVLCTCWGIAYSVHAAECFYRHARMYCAR